MGKTYDCITDSIAEFIHDQQMFFVATAPLADDGRVNLSPKGLDAFWIQDEQTVVYADMIGSGIETVAHLNENGRIVIMFCAFEGAPKIVRLHGRGEVVEPTHQDYDLIASQFTNYTGLRCFIRIHCDRVSDSCGWGVPLYEFKGQRRQLTDWAEQKGMQSLEQYVGQNNSESIDGLPGLQRE